MRQWLTIRERKRLWRAKFQTRHNAGHKGRKLQRRKHD